jgi:replicative DNA helicase
MTTPVYEFDAETQTEICSLLMWDHDFARRTDGLIKPAYLENDVERGFARLAIAFFRRYGEVPSRTAWVELVKDGFKLKPPIWREDQKKDVVERLALTARLTVRSRQFLLDKIAEFAQQQEITQAMISAAAELGKTHDPERFARIKDRLGQAFAVGLRDGDEDYDFFERIEERTEDRLARASGSLPRTGITTGIRELDGLLTTHGGWGRKELSLFMGAMKASKSFHLTSAAAAAVMAGKNVLFVTCENAIDIQARRIDAYMSDIAMSDFLRSPHTVRGAVEAVAVSGRVGKLKIREFPTMQFRPRDLERLIEEYKTKGLIFDLVVIDYLDLMTSDMPIEKDTERSKHIYARCRGIAMKEGFALLSATQTTRQGAKAAVATATDVAEDINRVRIADLVISINRTEEERANGKARLYIAAARNERDGVTLFITQDLDRGRAVKDVEAVE